MIEVALHHVQNFSKFQRKGVEIIKRLEEDIAAPRFNSVFEEVNGIIVRVRDEFSKVKRRVPLP